MSASDGQTLPEMSELLDVIREMVGEAHPHWKHLHFLPDTELERELGLDSMARLELHDRIVRRFDVSLPEDAAIGATTAAELMYAMTRPAGDDTDPAATVGSNAADLLMGEFGNRDGTASPPARTVTEWLYALYAWPVFVVIGLLAWLLVVLTPTEGGRRKMGHWCARLLFGLTFTPLEIEGHEHLDPHSAQIIVANHASYLDGFIITAALDIPIHFIVKGELAGNHAIRIILERFGVEFVDRFNASKGRSDVRRIADKARRGQSIVFFPEGTFTSFEGLQPFRMGAFVTACRANVPLVPVAISGARPIIRGSDWFPRRGRIRVTVCPPVMPAANNWQAALDLRDAARREMAPHTGEPDLVQE